MLEGKRNIKRTIIILLSLSIIILFRFLPVPEGLTSSGMQILGIFIGILIMWLTISIDWPSLLCIAALSFIPELSINEVLSNSIGSSTFSFLVFTFMCTYALSKTSFVEKIALAFVNSKFSRKGPWHFTILFFLSALILGMFMSPTVLFVIYLPILEEIYLVLGLKKGDKFASMLMMGMTLTMSIATAMTPIAHVFSIMAIGFYETATEKTISYLEYMSFGIPVGLVIFIIMILLFRFILNPDVPIFIKNKNNIIKDNTKETTLEEKLIIGIFLGVIILWILPDFIKNIFPELSKNIKKYGTAMPPLIGAIVMMIVTVEGKPLLSFEDAMKNGVSWASVFMAGSTLALGSALTHEEIGLTLYMSEKMIPLFKDISPLLFAFIVTLWGGIQTNISSNMVTVTVVSAVALPMAIASKGLVSTAGITCIIGFMSSLAFATPPAHPNVAIAGSSGWTNTKQMMIYGFILLFISILVVTFIGYPIASKI